jgi:hypothetical protein
MPDEQRPVNITNKAGRTDFHERNVQRADVLKDGCPVQNDGHKGMRPAILTTEPLSEQ